MDKLVVSLVTYNSSTLELSKVLSFTKYIKSLKVSVYIFDNANQKKLKKFCNKNNYNYFGSTSNIGFGSGHNYNIKKTIKFQPYYLILNPDIYLKSKDVITCLKFLKKEKSFGLLSPKLINRDGSLQFSCRLIPNLFDFILRFFFNHDYQSKKIHNFIEMDKRNDYFVNIPFIHGACYFIKSNVFKRIGLFDENFFLYLEDLDLYRRILEEFKTVYLKLIIVKHDHKRSSRNSLKLFFVHINSIIFYFLKWGFFIDKKKKDMNKIWKLIY